MYQRYTRICSKTLLADFEKAVVERVKRIRIGDPMAEDTNFGPLTSFPHMEKVLSFIESGKQQGAKVLIGGGRATEANLRKALMYYRQYLATALTKWPLFKKRFWTCHEHLKL